PETSWEWSSPRSVPSFTVRKLSTMRSLVRSWSICSGGEHQNETQYASDDLGLFLYRLNVGGIGLSRQCLCQERAGADSGTAHCRFEVRIDRARGEKSKGHS